ncbi:transglycosylase domain-containing protein [Bacillus marinisedimentorum]|uniref:transglycosylase domain-containing protein n=1 Tax=Bacillus marinisedimentorum TaxID=1821260 RepID=UPI000871B433|nr:PBP1A family penicillin-binding protein [Bacillus marinisedimentorum]
MMRKVLIGAVFAASALLLGLAGYIIIILAGEYVIDDKKLVMDSTSEIVDSKGNRITKIYSVNRELVHINDIPKHVQHAFIAVEDSRFYDHPGIDAQAIMRALYKDILAGQKVEGGSTITQQLAKNVFLSHEKTLLRKTKEAVIAINLERNYSKEKLLEMYLNQIYFGHGAYGIQSAAKLYFDKDISELTVDEGALLAGLPKAPSTYSPVNHPEKSKERRDLVLALMEKHGYIEPEQAVRSQGKTISVSGLKERQDASYTSYIDMVLKEANEKYHLSYEEVMTGGYSIKVPMDEKIQRTAYKLFQEEKYFPGSDEHVQGSFVLLDNKTGGVLSVIGGRNYVHKGLNRAVVKRQPGSALKPLAVYGPAIEEGKFGPYSMLVDEKKTYGKYTPENYDSQYDGEISMYDAIVHSDNAPAVWTMNEIGIDTGKKYLEKAAMPVPDEGLAIALGGLNEGVTPLQLAGAYRAFPAEGEAIEPFFILEIYNRDGEKLGEADPETNKVFSKQTAWYMTRMLSSVVEEGTARKGSYDGALAGKTGTTSFSGVEGAAADAWFAGYTPRVTGALWMGYDKTNKDQHLKEGSSYAAVLFKKILTDGGVKRETAFSKPDGVDDLENPIKLPEIDDLTVDMSFKALSLFTAELSWTPADDERVVYHIYEVKGGTRNKVGTVTGSGDFTVKNVNVFDPPAYIVVPYNKLTDSEGKPSNEAVPKYFDPRWGGSRLGELRDKIW